MAEPTDNQPLPLQEFWPLQALAADLQALCPLQALTPLQSLFVMPEPLGLWVVWALAANVPAANNAAAGLDPNAPLMQMNQEVVEISSASIPASRATLTTENSTSPSSS